MKRGLIWIALPLIAAAAGFWAGRARQEPPPPAVLQPETLPPARVEEQQSKTPKPAPVPEIVLTVTGAVQQPGVYSLPADARVHEALTAAGGVRLVAALDDINIAAPLLDGSVLTIPERVEGAGHGVPRAAQVNPAQYTRSGWQPGTAAADSGAQDGNIDLNSASQAELETLPGVGPVTAASIIAYRESRRFARVDDLTQVRGIGEKTLEKLRPFVTVR